MLEQLAIFLVLVCCAAVALVGFYHAFARLLRDFWSEIVRLFKK